MSSGQLPAELDLPLEAPAPTPLTVLGFELTPVRIGLLIGISGLAVAAVLGFTQIRPLLERIDKTQKEVEATQQKLTATQKQIADLANVKTQIEAAREIDNEITRLLPTPDNAETQLLDLNRLMKLSAVDLRSFQPSPVGPVAQAGGNPVPPDVNAQVQTQTTKVEMTGSYAETIQLMNNIERLQTLFRVNNLTVNSVTAAAQGAQASRGGPGRLSTQFDLQIYIYDKDAPVPTPVPVPSGTPAP